HASPPRPSAADFSTCAATRASAVCAPASTTRCRWPASTRWSSSWPSSCAAAAPQPPACDLGIGLAGGIDRDGSRAGELLAAGFASVEFGSVAAGIAGFLDDSAAALAARLGEWRAAPGRADAPRIGGGLSRPPAREPGIGLAGGIDRAGSRAGELLAAGFASVAFGSVAAGIAGFLDDSAAALAARLGEWRAAPGRADAPRIGVGLSRPSMAP